MSENTNSAINTSVSLATITDWFARAKPTPTPQNLSTQIGAHFEEFSEMCAALGLEDLSEVVRRYAEQYYQGVDVSNLSKQTRVELLDALGDQVVTATGVAYFAGMQWGKALSEINRSNFSKFEDGKPVLNEHGKIIKGKNYSKPNLADFV